jgi:hypothetical protein
MSRVAKEAYASKALAARRAGKQGRVVGFREALEAALAELAQSLPLADEARRRGR